MRELKTITQSQILTLAIRRLMSDMSREEEFGREHPNEISIRKIKRYSEQIEELEAWQIELEKQF